MGTIATAPADPTDHGQGLRDPGRRGTASPALDAALDRVTALEFGPPSRFVNHAPMACEALATLGHEHQIESWVPGFVDQLQDEVRPTTASIGAVFDWRDALGDLRRLPEWTGRFERLIADDGWRAVVDLWVPRLMPGLSSALFHGAIRTAHAVRALDAVDTSARRAELARALATWAARYRAGQVVEQVADPDDVGQTMVAVATDGVRCYVADPNIVHLHGVTGAMAVALLAGHVPPETTPAALAQLRADHQALYAGTERSTGAGPSIEWNEHTVRAAAGSHDAHQVKLVEACKRGFEASGDGSFVVAAELVTASV